MVLGRGTSAWASQSSLCPASSARLGQTGDLHLPTAPRAGRTQRLPDLPDSTHFQPPSSLGHVRTLLPCVSDLPPPPTPTAHCSAAAVGAGCDKAADNTDRLGSVRKEHFGTEFLLLPHYAGEAKPGRCCTAHGPGRKGREFARMEGSTHTGSQAGAGEQLHTTVQENIQNPTCSQHQLPQQLPRIPGDTPDPPALQCLGRPSGSCRAHPGHLPLSPCADAW